MADTPMPQRIAPGVHRVATGRGLAGVNSYLIETDSSWVLVDTSWPNRHAEIISAARSVFGADTAPRAILLTHGHPDHCGSARELARHYGVPVYLHPAELPFVVGEHPPAYPSALDRWIVVPARRLTPRRRREAVWARDNLAGVARAFEPGDDVPELPGWRRVHTPGHTPGHTAYFRPDDRVLLTGDAVLTINPNSVPDLIRMRHRISGPARFSSWDWSACKRSVAALAGLEPTVLGCGHGDPVIGEQAAHGLAGFATRFCAAGGTPAW